MSHFEAFPSLLSFSASTYLCSKQHLAGGEFLPGNITFSTHTLFKARGKDTKMKVFEREEVIISGGVLNLPQILNFSGIGRSSEIEGFNISVIVDFPGI